MDSPDHHSMQDIHYIVMSDKTQTQAVHLKLESDDPPNFLSEVKTRLPEVNSHDGTEAHGGSSSSQQPAVSFHVEITSASTLQHGNYDDEERPYPPNGSEDKSFGPLKHCIPRLCLYRDGPAEATGLAMDMYARGTVMMSSLFLGPALLQLAQDAADAVCVSSYSGDDFVAAADDDYDVASCDADARIYGMRPSSLLSNIAIVAGLFGSLLLPFFGAVVDHTPFRKNVGAVSAAGLTLVKGIEVMVSSRTWFAVALLQVVSALLYLVHLCAIYAYVSELTNLPSEQTKYNSYFSVVLYISSLLFLVEVIGLSLVIRTGDVGTARISQTLTFSTGCILFSYAWLFLFRDRPALSDVPEGSTLLKCGFQKVISTSQKIRRELPALKWFMVSVMFSESATSALTTVATTYMSHLLGMSSSEIGLIFLIVLLAGVPGTKLGEGIGLRYNPVTSAKICILLFITSTVTAAFYLTGPEAKHLTAAFGILWGVGLGWLHPMHTTIFCTIIPKGQESELMGMYIFCGQILSWLPPLVFTVLNEIGMNMAFGLASLNLFFAIGLILLVLVGDYSNAVEYVRVGSNVLKESTSVEMDGSAPCSNTLLTQPVTPSLPNII